MISEMFIIVSAILSLLLLSVTVLTILTDTPALDKCSVAKQHFIHILNYLLHFTYISHFHIQAEVTLTFIL